MPDRGRRRWYRGDCHVHSVISDGELTPAALIGEGRAAGLDFLASTEHNTPADRCRWARAAPGDLLVILGQEVTTEDGHWLALGLPEGQLVDWRYRVRDGVIGRHLDGARAAGGLSVVAHPHAPFPTGAFLYAYSGFDAVEVWNGLWSSDRPWNADNEAALAEWGRSLVDGVADGRWRPAIGGSDTHLARQIGIPQTVVLADDPTTPAILAGIRAGRCWIAASRDVHVSFEVTTHCARAEIGERVQTRGDVAVAHIAVQGVPSGTVSFLTDQGEVHRARLPDEELAAAEWRTTAAESAFVRVEVRYANGQMAALTNPIVLTVWE